jgi:hypothetical protein
LPPESDLPSKKAKIEQTNPTIAGIKINQFIYFIF